MHSITNTVIPKIMTEFLMGFICLFKYQAILDRLD